ncbi:Splicing factor YJU2-like protein [Drosera capensis]
MGERKVLNKYYPPDFDPAKIPRRKQPKNQQMKVRMMLPMSSRCSTCGNYIYEGTKFNSRKEDVVDEIRISGSDFVPLSLSSWSDLCSIGGFCVCRSMLCDCRIDLETYLGIQIFSFYMKCTKCSAEISMKTDPQNSDYVVEFGASRNFEPWRAEDEALENEKQKRDKEEMGDAMKSLENRTRDSKREMDILAALDEMKSIKSRHATVSMDAMLEALQRTTEDKERRLEEEDEKLIKSIVFQGSKDYIQRINDDLLVECDDNNDDDDDDGDEDFNDELFGIAQKKRKVSRGDFVKPSDYLASQSLPELTEKKEDQVSGIRIRKTSAVRISVVKKPTPASGSGKDSKVVEDSKQESRLDTSVAYNSGPSALLSLCQSYDNDEDE